MPHYQNDPQEIICGLDAISQGIINFFDNVGEYNFRIVFFSIISQVIKDLAPEFMSDHYDNVISNIVERCGIPVEDYNRYYDISYSKYDVFITSFSQSQDDLRQWLPYADDANGIAIGFAGDSIEKYEIKGWSGIVADEDATFGKISYSTDNNENHIKFVEALLKKYLEIFKKHFLNLGSLQSDCDNYPTFCRTVHRFFMVQVPLAKYSSYKDEKEDRLYVILNREEKKNNYNKMGYSVKNGIIRPYYEIVFNKASVSKLVLGPKCNKGLNRKSLEDLLHQYAYPTDDDGKLLCQIVESEIEYRG